MVERTQTVNQTEKVFSYADARAYLDAVGSRGNLLGLESVRLLMSALGNPQDQLKFVHIAGTNGKGSVMAFLEQTLMEAGYRVGRYISPVLFCYEEKIQVNRQMIPRETVAALTVKIKTACDEIARQGGPLPTIFEVETAMSFLYFVSEQCDLVLLEVGMGGREDATNIVTTTLLEIISSISMDHMAFLGDTLGQIAWNKAGIIKPGTLVVSDAQAPEAAEVIAREAAGENADLTFLDPEALRDVHWGLMRQQFTYKQYKDVVIHLGGTYQIRNAALALEAVDALNRLGYQIGRDAVFAGFARARWEGRFQVLQEHPTVVMDGAHNPDAAWQLRRSLETYFPGKRIYYIFGVFSDKEYDKIIGITAPLASHIFTVMTKDNPRALNANVLAEHVALVNPNVTPITDAPLAFRRALELAAPEDVIVIFGSLSWLWEAKLFFSRNRSED